MTVYNMALAVFIILSGVALYYLYKVLSTPTLFDDEVDMDYGLYYIPTLIIHFKDKKHQTIQIGLSAVKDNNESISIYFADFIIWVESQDGADTFIFNINSSVDNRQCYLLNKPDIASYRVYKDYIEDYSNIHAVNTEVASYS